MATCSKALGGYGGILFGSRTLIDYLRNRARTFIYTTALPPTVATANLAALELIARQPELRDRLRHNGERLRRGCQRYGMPIGEGRHQILPVLLGDSGRALRVAERLLEAGVLVPAIRPPTVPDGTARLRITVTAKHTDAQIDQLVDALHRGGQAEGLW